MCTQTQATVQVLILPQLHTSLLGDFLREERRGEERLKWNCHDPSIQCLIHFTSACRLLLSAIELPNRSLLDNWKTCHFVIWHTLCENHSHTFLMQRQIKEVFGMQPHGPPSLCLLCTYSRFFFIHEYLLSLCVWVSPLHSCMHENNIPFLPSYFREFPFSLQTLSACIHTFAGSQCPVL